MELNLPCVRHVSGNVHKPALKQTPRLWANNDDDDNDYTADTSGYAMVVHGRPKTPKNQVFGVTRPQGSYSPYILGDTTRPGHVTCVLV